MYLPASPPAILLSLNLFMSFFACESAIKLPEKGTIPAVFAFGDSSLDTGNNNQIAGITRCDFPPYGRDFPGGIATGRFGNGKILSDIVAETLGVKETLPAYLDPTLETQDLLTGVCFASSGCGYDPVTPTYQNVLSFPDQVELFREYIEKLKAVAGEKRAKTILNDSVYMVSSSNNDLIVTYFLLGLRKVQYDLPGYCSFLASKASEFYKEIYELGARKIWVFSAISLGCEPFVRTIAGGVHRNCSDEFNEAAMIFNDKLSSVIDNLNRNLPQADISYLDLYQSSLSIIKNPQKYGFEVADKGCCGTGEIEFSYFCNELSPFTCKNDSKYLFWDSIHPSERGYRILLPLILQN